MTLYVPGSEKFNSRPLPLPELRNLIPPILALHEIGEEEVEALDPLTYEVIRHRLWSITEEMGHTMMRISGSPVVTEAQDFNFSLCDELGQTVQVGLFNVGLVASMDLAIQWILQHRGENPGIEEGDLFLLNDPWVGGGLHQNDAALIAPIFCDGVVFGWSTAICHGVDVGGVAPGSFTPQAVDVFWEGLPTPPVKIARNYALQDDVVDMWLRRSRTPLIGRLDLHALMGANLVARDQMKRLVARYGTDTVKAVMKRMLDDAERRLRNKLRSASAGTWRSVGYQEQSHQGDRGVYPIVLEMTKRDDQLIFDFTGTSAQAGMINCPYPGMRAGIMFALLPLLCGDIPWSPGGFMRCFDIISEDGTVNNATFPAAVGKAPVSGAWSTANVVAECLARMLDTSDELRSQVQAICAGGFDFCTMAGLDQRNVPFVGLLTDPMAAGYGAQVGADGGDTSGLFVIPQGRSPDAEMTEFMNPVLVLWRREETDTGGPGRFRGGVGGSICVVPHDTAAPMALTLTGSGKAAPMNTGMAGGHPGNTQFDVILRGTDVSDGLNAGRIPGDVAEITGDREVVPPHLETTLAAGDALVLAWQAGGGYGDPIRREPQLVAHDVAELKVSVHDADEIYGVVIDPSNAMADGPATNARRERILAQRRAQAVMPQGEEPDLSTGPADPGNVLDDNVAVCADGTLVCRHCRNSLGQHGDNYLEPLPRRYGDPAEAGSKIWRDARHYVNEDTHFRQFYCPGCYTAVLSQVVFDTHPVLIDRAP